MSSVQQIQARTLRVLVVGQIAGSAALSAAVTVGAFVIQDLLGQTTPWGGIASATVTIGTAFMAQLLSRLMLRQGRRVGLMAGYSMAIVGGLVAGLGVELQSLTVFLIGLFLFGNGQSANLLSRYAATDLAEPTERGAAMSRILFASTFGAVFGPLLIRPAEELGKAAFGWNQYTGPWVFSGLFFLTSLINVSLRLKPDPLVVAGGLRSQQKLDVNGVASPGVKVLSFLKSSAKTRLAFYGMMISHITMVAVMTMTPVHLRQHGHETVSAYIISLHIAGMYAFSPFIGRFSDRNGRLNTMLVGCFVLIVSTVMSAFAGSNPIVFFPSLWLLGIGWSFGLIGASSLLVDSVPIQHRVRVQGSADVAMSLCGGLAGFSSGFIRKSFGFPWLSMLGTFVVLGLTLTLLLNIEHVVAAES
ncbi:MAG: MFS transporter [Actinobacteria bacterium]|nr:MFS transporter [Actinomycetota bacterium]MDA2998410.1 MFS transporter [Actinomycetota bacterium]